MTTTTRIENLTSRADFDRTDTAKPTKTYGNAAKASATMTIITAKLAGTSTLNTETTHWLA